MTTPIFPTILIALNIAAALEALWRGDAARMGYWIAAAVLNACITFPLPRFPWNH